MKQYLKFAGKFTVAHVLTYLLVGGIAYPLLTKEFYVGANPVFSTFMVTQNEPELWNNVVKWIVPAQILRGILLASVLYPFFETINGWSYVKRFLTLSSLYIVIGFWASAVAAPGTIDGMVYMRPEITMNIHLQVQWEIVTQGILLSAWIAKWMRPKAITSAID